MPGNTDFRESARTTTPGLAIRREAAGAPCPVALASPGVSVGAPPGHTPHVRIPSSKAPLICRGYLLDQRTAKAEQSLTELEFIAPPRGSADDSER